MDGFLDIEGFTSEDQPFGSTFTLFFLFFSLTMFILPIVIWSWLGRKSNKQKAILNQKFKSQILEPIFKLFLSDVKLECKYTVDINEVENVTASKAFFRTNLIRKFDNKGSRSYEFLIMSI